MGYPFTLNIAGRRYRVRLARRDMKAGGFCECPHNPPPHLIKVGRGDARGQGTADAQEHAHRLLHEILHAAGWWASEEWVEETSLTLAEGLEKAGLLNQNARI